MSKLPEPTPIVGIKLASIAVHAREAVSKHGHHFDLDAVSALLADPDVAAYMEELRQMALLPIPRPAAVPSERER